MGMQTEVAQSRVSLAIIYNDKTVSRRNFRTQFMQDMSSQYLVRFRLHVGGSCDIHARQKHAL